MTMRVLTLMLASGILRFVLGDSRLRAAFFYVGGARAGHSRLLLSWTMSVAPEPGSPSTAKLAASTLKSTIVGFIGPRPFAVFSQPGTLCLWQAWLLIAVFIPRLHRHRHLAQQLP